MCGLAESCERVELWLASRQVHTTTMAGSGDPEAVKGGCARCTLAGGGGGEEATLGCWAVMAHCKDTATQQKKNTHKLHYTTLHQEYTALHCNPTFRGGTL